MRETKCQIVPGCNMPHSYLLAQSLHLGIFLDLQISVLLFERLYDSLEVLVLPPGLQDVLLRPGKRLAVTSSLTK